MKPAWLKQLGSIPTGPMGCSRCGAEFPASQARVNGRGDPACPHCGSADIRHRPTRKERLRSFLIDYNTY